MTGSLTDSVQISFAINAARSKGPAILVLVREVPASSGLNYEMVGLSVPYCELLGGRFRFEECGLLGRADESEGTAVLVVVTATVFARMIARDASPTDLIRGCTQRRYIR